MYILHISANLSLALRLPVTELFIMHDVDQETESNLRELSTKTYLEDSIESADGNTHRTVQKRYGQACLDLWWRRAHIT